MLIYLTDVMQCTKHLLVSIFENRIQTKGEEGSDLMGLLKRAGLYQGPVMPFLPFHLRQHTSSF
jgi:hypothetical protein